MKITNILNLPLPIVEAVRNDPYDNHDTLSVTTLLRPPQAYALTKRHAGEMSEDASDRIWALVGQIGHLVVERAAELLNPAEWITERRFFMELDGVKLSGQADLIEVASKTVFDTKFTSGWAVKDAVASGKSDWQMQLSMLALLARANGIEIEHGKIIAIVRDWTETQALRMPDWPQRNIAVIDMDILSEEETYKWIMDRLSQFARADAGQARPCTDEERWFSPGKWAVNKVGVNKAAKLADSEDELSAWIFANKAKLGSNYEITQRPAVYKRCAKYCSAAPFCPQYQKSLLPDHALAPGEGEETNWGQASDSERF